MVSNDGIILKTDVADVTFDNKTHHFFQQKHMSSVQNPGWLFYIEDYTTQLYRDYFISHEIRVPSLTNQYFMECHVRVWFTLRICVWCVCRFFSLKKTCWKQHSKSFLQQPSEPGRSLELFWCQEVSSSSAPKVPKKGPMVNLPGQIITTKPPSSHSKMWWKVRESPENALNSGLGWFRNYCNLPISTQVIYLV